MKTKTLAAALCAALTIAAPAAAADCWSGEQAAAARIRDLQSKLMVATMRCHAMGIDISAAYNGFVRANRPRLEAVNGRIKARFAAVWGGGGQFQYDRFTTSLANAYGADATSAELCNAFATASLEAEAVGGDEALLLNLADRLGASPRLPGGQCVVPPVLAVANVAAAAPVEPAPLPSVALASLDAQGVE